MLDGGSSALKRCASIEDLRLLARRRVPRLAFDYMDGGAESEAGLARNRAGFQAIELVPRYLRDVRERHTATTLFGRSYAYPFGIAPTGLAGLVWPGADAMLVAEASRRALPFVLSTPATLTIEEAARRGPGHVWFQLYVLNDREITRDLLRRARDSGVDVAIVTVDIPVAGKRERDLRNRFTLPLRPSLPMARDIVSHPRWAAALMKHGAPEFANLAPYAPAHSRSTQSLAAFMTQQLSAAVTWEVIAFVRAHWPGKLIVKGLLHPDDARAALDQGVDGILVSNHGGRQLDACVAPISVLPEIVDAVQGRLPVLFDSGVRRGLDIVKALALGADFVFAGRPTLYGAGAGGQAGVARALDILLGEFRGAMGQLGATCLADLRAVTRRMPAGAPLPPVREA